MASKVSAGGETGSELPDHGTEATDLIIDASKTRLIASDQTVGGERRRAAARVGRRRLDGDNDRLGGRTTSYLR